MKRRIPGFVWTLWLLVIVLAVVAFAVRQWNSAALLASPDMTGVTLLMEVVYWLVLIPAAVPAYATVGALIAARHGRNPVGWLCLLLALVLVTQDIAWQYASRGVLIAPGSLPAAVWMDWYATLCGACWFVLPTLILLHFPTGQIASRRWRWAAWWTLGNLVIAMGTTLVGPRLNFSDTNPTTIPAIATAADAVYSVLVWSQLAALLAAFVSLVLRWRRAGGIERQQLKWLAYSGAVIVVAGVVALVPGSVWGASVFSVLLGAVAIGGLSIGVPTAIGIAILRYHLFDIDFLINRTLVYSVLTALLGLIYVGSVVALQRLLTPVAGQSNQLAVVGSTLAIATLFQPLRRQIQRVIDRRFYRRRYSARRTLESYGTKLRAQTDLHQLTDDLVHVVQDTLQPAHVSLWLCEPRKQ